MLTRRRKVFRSLFGQREIKATDRLDISDIEGFDYDTRKSVITIFGFRFGDEGEEERISITLKNIKSYSDLKRYYTGFISLIEVLKRYFTGNN